MAVKEFDNSINDRLDKIRSAFNTQFPMQYADGEYSNSWVADIFDNHVVVRQGDKYFEVGFTESDNGFTFDSEADWTPVKLSYVAEMNGTFRDTLVISELLKDKTPDIKLFSDVDYKSLVAGDSDPVFVTLPIAKVNSLSGNKRFYNEKFVEELIKQVKSKKPIGLMGHLSPDQIGTEFPEEAVHWVGVQRIGEFVWGKGYVPPNEARKRLQRYKATNKQIATSIFAKAQGEWDTKLKAYVMQADTLELSQIDIAPQDRAGISDLAAVPYFTSEMLKNGELNSIGANKMGQETEVVVEMESLEKKMFGKIEELLGVTGDEVVGTIQELVEFRNDQRKQVVKDRIQELVNDPEKGIKIPLVKGLVTELIQAKNPETVEDVDKIYSELIESDTVKETLTEMVQKTMGPPQTVAVGSQVVSDNKSFNIPKI